MKVEKDYVEFFALLNRHKVKYCVVGSYAVAFHARPRYTKDIDIFIEPSKENAKKMARVLIEYGFKSAGLSEKDFSVKGRIVQLGYEPVRIDIVTDISGCEFKEVWGNRAVGKYGTENVYFIGMNDLIKNKAAAGRLIDRSDLELLQKAKQRR